MKNKIVLLNILLFILFSCSSDNDDNDDIDVINKPESKTQKVIRRLSIKKLTYVDSNQSPQYQTNTYEFSYENGQVSKLTDLEQVGSYRDFEYDNDKKLIKILKYNKNELDNTVELFYSDNLLSNSNTIKKGEIVHKGNFHYTQNLLTMSESCLDDSCSSKFTDYIYTYNSTNNIESISAYTFKDAYLYDQKINPFEEYNPYFKIVTNNDLYLTLSHNNRVREDFYYDNSSVAEHSIIYTITYDNENYPLTIEGKDAVTGEFKASYAFEYQTIMVDQEK
ncbi:hypothetical protein [Apibacter adventoris]|uniref:hypothetical protein n=1 Tax=Apibacter adventoris TaxID=1679466 RepID=UPI000CF61F73|nr:hypothetical protein [Apibacter adventoris]PQL93551.1 hypothetical protein C4S76_07860 [Apibacter adventoris]